MHNQTIDSAIASKWKVFWAEYANVLEAPHKLVARVGDHRIDLISPMVQPPDPQMYGISEDELVVIKCTISDYM